MAEPAVEIRRSARRRTTVSVRREGEKYVALVPARMTRAQEAEVVDRLIRRLRQREGRTRVDGDADLTARAKDVATLLVPDRPELVERLASVAWSDATTRWGSCSTVSGRIRISTRLRGAPTWVVDHVLLHELAHLVEPGHGPAFHAIADRHPKRERAEGFLAGLAMGLGSEPADTAELD
jgi:predicted metal-dependent hydrolase